MTPAHPDYDALVGVMKDAFMTEPQFPAVIYSPFNIDVLMWYHTRPVPHPRIDIDSVREFTNTLLALGVIESCEYDGDSKDKFQTTELGKAWVRAICKVPKPRQVYVDHSGTIL